MDVKVTQLLQDLDRSGDASQELMALVYDSLRSIAERRMAGERAGHTLQATALVNEAFLRLVGDEPVDWQSRRHFFGAAAEAMRRILIDRARRRSAEKRGGDRRREPLDGIEIIGPDGSDEELLALDEALRRLEATDAAGIDVVKLRYFAGLTMEQTAEVLGISIATANRRWTVARAHLAVEMSGAGDDPGET